jgi:biotin carboxyl carrier protein
MIARELHWRIHEQDVSCRIEEFKDHGVFHVAGRALPFRFLDSSHIEIDGKRHRFYVIHDSNVTTVWLDGRTYSFQRAYKVRGSQTATAQSTGEIRAIMPGKLLRVIVNAGDTVAEKQMVAIMESMKMETALFSPISGHVADIRRKPGAVLEMGDVVMVIEKEQS